MINCVSTLLVKQDFDFDQSNVHPERSRKVFLYRNPVITALITLKCIVQLYDFGTCRLKFL
jgi:hypothetical protein